MYAIIKEIARDFVVADSTVILRPQFNVDRASRLLSYDLGYVPPVRLGLDPSDPLSTAIQEQVRIEVLRRGLEESQIGAVRFEGLLNRADSAVFRMVVAIVHNNYSGSAFRARLARERGVVDNVFRDVGQEVRAWSSEQGLGVQMAGRGVFNEYYQVKVTSNPVGGRIEVVPELDYNTAVRLGRSLQSLSWRTLAAAKENLIGWYYYRISWPSLPMQTGRMLVSSAHDITLPNP